MTAPLVLTDTLGGSPLSKAARAGQLPQWFVPVPRTAEEWRVIYLIIATIPGGIGGLLLNKYAESAFRSPALIAAALIVLGLMLWSVDRLAPHTRPLDSVASP